MRFQRLDSHTSQRTSLLYYASPYDQVYPRFWLLAYIFVIFQHLLMVLMAELHRASWLVSTCDGVADNLPRLVLKAKVRWAWWSVRTGNAVASKAFLCIMLYALSKYSCKMHASLSNAKCIRLMNWLLRSCKPVTGMINNLVLLSPRGLREYKGWLGNREGGLKVVCT